MTDRRQTATWIAALMVMSGIVGACVPGATTPVVPATQVIAASPVPRASDAVPQTTVFESEADGVRSVLTFDRTEVEPSGTVTGHLEFTNERQDDVTIVEPCGAGTMTVLLPVPVEPLGKSWTGVQGAFKEYSLTSSQGSPMEWSIREPLTTTGRAGSCDPGLETGPVADTVVLASGATYETDVTWAAELVRDIPSPAGSMPFTVAVRYAVEAVENGLVMSETIETTGSITVLPGGPPALSAGQVLDSAIADARFDAWLTAHPPETWVNTNLFLQPGANHVDGLPSVPYWEVDLFAEPRSWIHLDVDAVTGAVLTHRSCEVPCAD